MEQRKATYRMYPTHAQAHALDTLLGLHQRVYNAALEERIRVYRETGTSLGFAKQCKALTQWRHAVPALAAVNAQSLQVTLKRLSLAFDAFFRRAAAKGGEKPGFPRFKSPDRFSGWGYKTHGDGWTLHAGEAMCHGTVRLAGVGRVKLRGRPRTVGTPKTAEVLHKAGKWYLSVTLQCAPKRQSGTHAIGLDWGLEHFATTVDETGHVRTIDNPRFQDKAHLQRLKSLQRAVARKRNTRSHNRRQTVAALAKETGRLARRRRDFLHKQSATIVSNCALIATEELSVKNMTAHGGTYKRDLNRSILDTAPAAFLSLLHSKAEEAGCAWVEAPTRQVKPSQTCPQCGAQRKKNLAERWHSCPCGAEYGRDEASARVMLNWALFGSATGREPCQAGSGSRLATWNRETHAIAAQAV